MDCPLCSSSKVQKQDMKYPYYCTNCKTAFSPSDNVVMNKIGQQKYKEITGKKNRVY